MNERTKQNCLYFPLGLFLHALALLPFCVLYGISDICFFFIYHVFHYRYSITRKNIYESFPDKSDKEKNKIIKEFYRNFTDNFVETIKLLHISDKEMKKRIVFKNIEAVDESVANGRSVIVYAAHFCNWEWLSAITLWTKEGPDIIQFGQVYRPLKNEWFDRFFLNLRSRFHSSSYPKNSVVRHLLRAKNKGKITVTGFISDQHPNFNDRGDVIRFLNHDTAMITGTEVIAKKLDIDVMCFDIIKVKRGHYICTITEITRSPKDSQQYEITNKYASLLETAIRTNPSNWLWTHNRWKNKVTLTNKLNNE